MQTASGTAESDVSRRLHEHGHQVGRQPLHQRPQLLLHERRAAGQQHRRRPARAPRPAAGAADRRGRQPDRHLATTGARRWAARSSATRRGSSARSAGGGSTSSRSARSTPTARRPSTTTASATSWARRPGRRRRPSAPRSCSTATSRTASIAATRRTCSSRTRRRCCRTSRRRTTSRRYNHVRRPGDRGRRALRPHVGRVPERATRTRCADRHRHPRRQPLHAHQRRRDAVAQPERPLSGATARSATSAGLARRRHATTSRPALQLSWEKMEYDRIRNGDILLELQRRRAVPGAARQHADQLRPPAGDLGRVPAGPLGARPRHHQRRRPRRRRQRATCRRSPARPAPSSASAAFPKTDVFDFGPNVAPRLGISYDLFGNGRTALKAYYGRFYNQFGSEIAEAANPNALVNQAVAWNDRNGNLRLDPGELGPRSPASRAACSRPSTRTPTGPTATRFNVGVEHQLVRNLAVGVSYHRRQHRNGLGILDRGRGRRAPTRRVARTYIDPERGRRRRSPSTTCEPAFGHRAATASSPTSTSSRATTTACSSTSRSGCRTAGRCSPG